ncbi:MAG: hypothetical protein OEV31_03885 [Gammaproteobacteria bacterium]|nr:hypothetical protein [Gammaproteobacteria bacterium]
MPLRKLLTLFAALLLTAPASPVFAAETPIVAVLRYSDGWFAPRAKIRLASGTVASPLAGTARARWALLPGDTLRQNSQPAERLIQFYNIQGNTVRVLCSVMVKYTLTPDGWKPRYTLVLQPQISLENGKPSLIPDEDTARGGIHVLTATSPDGDGFYGGLVFADIQGAVSIDAWEVQ